MGELMSQIVYMPLTAGSSSQTPNRVVVHAIAEFIDGVPAVDFLRSVGLSAHAFVTCSGVIIRCREDTRGAYHAKGYNTNSLGIEFLVPGNHDYTSFKDKIRTPYLTENQYKSGLWQIKEWFSNWLIGDISRHSDLDPARKTDPGDGFPWEKLLKDINS